MHGLLGDTSPSTTPWALIAVGAATIIYLTIVRPMRKNKQQQKDPLARAPSHSGLAQQRMVEREMTNLLVEYEEMIRRMTAQVDTRAAKLELLLREADEKLARLNAAVAQTPVGGPTSSAVAALPAPADGTTGGAAPAATTDPAPAVDVPDRRHKEIYTLADRGRSIRQIAKQLKQPEGEIELILALRGAKP